MSRNFYFIFTKFFSDLSTTTTTISTTEARFSTVISSTQRTPPITSTSAFVPITSSNQSPRNLDFVSSPNDATIDSGGNGSGGSSSSQQFTEDLPVLQQPSTSSVVRNRFRRKRKRRQTDETGSKSNEVDIGEDYPFFKGIIQDVQISNGGNYTRIVELFKETIEDQVTIPASIGPVRITNVDRGVVSDNVCENLTPCQQGGTCKTTWNDYICMCPPGFFGRNCTVTDYCHFYTCPEDSTCNTLEGGAECISNSTFNGVDSELVVRLGNISETKRESITDEIKIKFRTQSHHGTLLHVSQDFGNFIHVYLNDSFLYVGLPENDDKIHDYKIEAYQPSDTWQMLNIHFSDDRVDVKLNDAVLPNVSPTITLDSKIDKLLDFVQASQHVIVGAFYRDQDNHELNNVIIGEDLASTANTNENEVEAAGDGATEMTFEMVSFEDHYRGCMGELRIGGILIPYYRTNELVNDTASVRFNNLFRSESVDTSECIVCFQHECLNGGTCERPEEEFECTCPNGYEDSLCSTNTDECLVNSCLHGECVDRYVCLHYICLHLHSGPEN